MRKKLKMTMTAFAAALALTTAIPACAAESTDLATLSATLDDLQSQVDMLQGQIDACKEAIENATGEDVVAAPVGENSEAGEAVSADGPLGDNIILGENHNYQGYATLQVYKSEFTSEPVQAIAAADDSMKIAPANGNQMYHAQFIICSGNRDLTMGSILSCQLVADGKVYENGRLMYEAHSAGGDSALKENINDLLSQNYEYLCSTKESGKTMDSYYVYSLLDYAVEVPSEVVESAESVYLQMKLVDRDLYFTVK